MNAALLVVNPHSGRGRGEKLAVEASTAAAKGGLETLIVIEDSAAKTLATTERALQEKRFETLLAIGGDGLVHLLIPLAIKYECNFAVIASGTGNDFARSNGTFKFTPTEIIDLLIYAKPSQIDLGVVKSGSGLRYFGQILSLGFDANVNERANRAKFLKGPIKYLIAVIFELVSFRAMNFTLTVDGKVSEERAMLIAIANGKTYGGGLKVAPGAVRNDGQLDLIVVGKISKLKFLFIFPKIFWGGHIHHKEVKLLRGSTVTVAANAKAYADGEYVDRLPVEVTVAPLALKVYQK